MLFVTAAVHKINKKRHIFIILKKTFYEWEAPLQFGVNKLKKDI